jgi:hypothetical protein
LSSADFLLFFGSLVAMELGVVDGGLISSSVEEGGFRSSAVGGGGSYSSGVVDGAFSA